MTTVESVPAPAPKPSIQSEFALSGSSKPPVEHPHPTVKKAVQEAARYYAKLHQLGFGLQFGTLQKFPEFEAYFARVSARPAYRRANEIDDALMPE